MKFENDFFNSYYYSNIIDNILTQDIELIGFINSFKEIHDWSILKPFQKFSAFHYFIKFIVHEFFLHEMYNHDLKEFETYLSNSPLRKMHAEWPLENYNLKFSFESFIGNKTPITIQDIEAYHEELILNGYINELSEKLTHEVFYVLFNNRNLLLRFNYIMIDFLNEYPLDYSNEKEFCNLFSKEFVLKRINIPQWVKNAIFFRDRGVCCKCQTDLSGLLKLNFERHFDHIVPLAQGGINDVSNIQLLCSSCNLSKGSSRIYTSNLYEKWY